MKTFPIILAVAIAARSLHAQIVNDGATNTLSNTTNTFTDVTVGTNGSFTLLILSNNALLTNSGNGTIGLNTVAKSNEVRLLSPSARWLMGGSLFVGSNGSFNRLVVSNGAFVRNNSGSLGLNFGSSNNLALVTGPGSVWSNAVGLTLGFNGAGNQLIVSNGGVVRNSSSTVGINNSSTSNAVMVTGSGSLWSNAAALQFGFNGAGNQLVISNGGVLRSSLGQVGSLVPSSNNLAVVTGSGSLWTNTTDLYVGHSGVGNRLVVSDGGAVRNGHGYVGGSAPGSNNLALITGAGSSWSNALDLNIGAFSSNNRMIVSNSATVFAANNGFIGTTANGNANSVTVTDPGTRWLLSSNLYVGSNGAASRLVISNGARVEDNNGVLGNGTSSSNNLAVVTGAGSLWTNALDLYVGYSGSGNQLVVSNGATVLAGNFSTLGYDLSANSNTVTVSGAGSLWSNGLDLLVGDFGPANRLEVNNGGRVLNSNAFVGRTAFSPSNTVVVTGTGSLWSNRADVSLGGVGSGNLLVVSNGGWVVNSNASVGASSLGNVAMVSGAGSVWSNRADVYVGEFGSANQLVARNGATVFVGGNGVLGKNSIASSNLVTVTDAGTRWLLSSNLYVGSNGASSRLVISNAALVANVNGILGFGVSSSSNVALITGTGSVWSNQQNLIVGDLGSGNRLEVSDGARVESRIGTVGRSGSPSNNQVVVTGPGSFWNMEQSITVGDNGGGHRLVITNGGRVRVGGVGSVGSNLSSTNNEVIVTGVGSSWTNSGPLHVGANGSGNRLLISNGGEVVEESFNINLGSGPFSANNRIVVDGGALRVPGASGVLDIRRGTNVLNAGLIDVTQLLLTNALGKFEFNGGTLITRGAVISSGPQFIVGGPGGVPATWDVRAGAGSGHHIGVSFVVGGAASFAQVIHTNGALLTNDFAAFLGQDAASRSNSVTLAGSATRWWLGDGVVVGDAGSDNRLVVRDGASLVTASISYLGTEIPSSNNEAVVTGPGSFWNSNPEYGLSVGFRGRNNLLRVNNGAQIASGPSVLGELPTGSNNLALVTDAGSLWKIQGGLRVGGGAAANHLVVSNSGSVFATDAVYAGFDPTSTRNRLTVDGGTLRTTNVSATGTLDVRRGTNVLNAGFVEADRLFVTNTLGQFDLNGGTVSVRNSIVNNAQPFRVGNGVSLAAFNLAGNGSHSFANGLTVSANALLTGNGTISGAVPLQLLAGSRLAPGASVGKIVLSNSPLLQGATIMEISKDGATLTNDQIQVIGPVAYGGSLIVSNLGPGALAAGDRFPLFSATSYSGGFTNISLPPLAAGLAWTNKMVFDGSIEVVGFSQPKIASIIVSGTNIIISGSNGPPNAFYAVLASTNLTLPLSNWVSLVTNQFDSSGNFSFTNAIVPGIPQRFYRIRTP